MGAANLTVNVIRDLEGIAQSHGSSVTEDPFTGTLYNFNVAPAIQKIEPSFGSMRGGSLITVFGTSFGT